MISSVEVEVPIEPWGSTPLPVLGQCPHRRVTDHKEDLRYGLQVEAVFNEFVQMEKRTLMSEYEQGDAGADDYNLGGHGGAQNVSTRWCCQIL